ncbi:hypothetical protein KR067_000461, partial [Drosophila pandora]
GNKVNKVIKTVSATSSPAVAGATAATSASGTPVIKQIAVKHVAKTPGAQAIATSQRVALPIAQIKNKLLLAQQQQSSA